MNFVWISLNKTKTHNSSRSLTHQTTFNFCNFSTDETSEQLGRQKKFFEAFLFLAPLAGPSQPSQTIIYVTDSSWSWATLLLTSSEVVGVELYISFVIFARSRPQSPITSLLKRRTQNRTANEVTARENWIDLNLLSCLRVSCALLLPEKFSKTLGNFTAGASRQSMKVIEVVVCDVRLSCV